MFGFGPNYNNGYSSHGLSLRLLIGLAIAGFGIFSYFTHTSVNPVTGEAQHVNMTAEQETALGLQSAPQMASQMGGLVSPANPKAAFVQYVGNRVWHASDAARSPYQYQYHLLNDSQTVNAFALPGGQVFITLGLYSRLSDEAELAAVLGHETGHVVERHSAQQLEKGQLGARLVTAVGIGASDRRNGLGAAMAAALVNQVTQLRFSRNDETQADDMGLRYITQAGYEPQAMIDLMKVLMDATGNGGRQPEFLVTHPHPETRIEDIQQQLKKNYPNGIPRELIRGQRLP